MISYGGRAVHLETPGPECTIRAKIFEHMRLDEATHFGCEPQSVRSGRLHSIAGTATGLGIPRPNYPDPPANKMTTLYWPTGATRFARCHFMVVDTIRDYLLELSKPDGRIRPHKLRFWDETQPELETDMYMLAPRRISNFDNTPEDRADGERTVWYITLVDERYWWQFKSCDNLRLQPGDSWRDLFAKLGDALGTTIELGDIPPAYLTPDPVEFSRGYDSPAVLLDAAAHSIGCRIVRNLDGTVKAMRPEESRDILRENIRQARKVMGGPDAIGRNLCQPAVYRVSYPRVIHSHAVTSGTDQAAFSVAVGDRSATKTDGTKIIRTTAHANFGSGDTENAHNSPALMALAEQITADYIGWTNYGCHDVSLAGIAPWNLTGYDDAVEWFLGHQLSSGKFLCHARVQGLPANFGVEDMLHQDPSVFVIRGSTALGKLDFDTEEGGSAIVSVWAGSTIADTGVNVIARDWLNAGGKAGDVVVLHWHETDNRWVYNRGGGGPGVFAFELTEALEPGGTAAAKLEDNTEIVVKDWTESDPALRGDTGFRGWAVPAGDPLNPELHLIVSMESYAPRIQCELYENMGQTTANRASVENVVGVGGRVPVLPPDVKLIVHDTQGLFKRALAGAKCEALYNAKEERYEVVECQTKAGWVIFQAVNSPSVETGIFNAKVVEFGGTQQDVQDPPRINEDNEIAIYSSLDVNLTIANGDFGVAQLNTEDNQYYVVNLFASGDAGKVKLTSLDTLGYLPDKIHNYSDLNSIIPVDDLIVRWAINSSGRLAAFIRASDLTGYNGSNTQALVHSPTGWRFINIQDC